MKLKELLKDGKQHLNPKGNLFKSLKYMYKLMKAFHKEMERHEAKSVPKKRGRKPKVLSE